MSVGNGSKLERRIGVKTGLARLALTIEELTRCFWVPLALLAAFLGFALLEIPQYLGQWYQGWLHLGLLLVFVAAFLATLRAGIVRFRGQDVSRARRRVEEESGFSHRPLTAFEDEPVISSGAGGQALWRAHQARLAENMSRLRAGTPRPVLAGVDRFALASVATVSLVAGLFVAGGDIGARVAAALTPDVSFGAPSEPATLDLWINPPGYTGLPPVMLSRSTDVKPGDNKAGDAQATEQGLQVVQIPFGSELLARVNTDSRDTETLPTLIMNQGDADTPVPFERVGDQKGMTSHHLSLNIEDSTAISLRSGEQALGDWTLTVIPDQYPTIAFGNAEEIGPSERGALQLHFTAEDDYGVREVGLTIHRLTDKGVVTEDPPIEIGFPVPRGDRRKLDERQFRDLTPHPWAGQPVRMQLSAIDDLDQKGESKTLDITLPERQFNHPVARAIIEQRKRLVTEPDEHEDIARIIIAIAARPHHYFNDNVVFLGLKIAATRLFRSKEQVVLEDVQSLLWNLALKVEDGELSIAERELRELEQALQDALANNAPQEEIDRLFRELQKAMEKFLKSLAEQMPEGSEQDQQQQAQIDPERMLTQKDLMDMLRQAQEMSKSGSRDMARRMLNQLRRMMENMRAGRMPQQSRQQRAMQQMMQQLQDMARRQKSLMDRTWQMHQQGNQQQDRQQQGQQGQRGEQQQGQQGQQQGQQGQQGRQGQQPGDGTGPGQLTPEDLAQMQERLRRALGRMMQQMDEATNQIPDGLGKAERSMKEAFRALQNATPGDAVDPQSDALEQLQNGAQAMQRELQRMRQAQGQGQGDPDMMDDNDDTRPRDPLNPDNARKGFANGDNVKVPEESDLQKAREIFEELRRRSGQRDRPQIELDYIERLLKRF